MSFLEGLFTTARNAISDRNAGIRHQTEENDLPPIDEDRPLQPIHETLEETNSSTLTVEQLDEKIRKLSLKVIVAKEAGITKSLQQRDEMRWLKQELQVKDAHLAERNYRVQNAPIDVYEQHMRTAYVNDKIPWASREDQQMDAAASPTGSLTETMQTGLCAMLEINLLKKMHLLMIAEKQLQIQSSIWNDIVMNLHEKSGTLDENFMDSKVRILSEISTTEKYKTQLEKAGEEQVRKQVMSMCQLKREVALEVKRKTSQLEEQVFTNGHEDGPTRQILRSLSSESFSAGLDTNSDHGSPAIAPRRKPPQRQGSSLKLRLAREKAAARLADSKLRFSVGSTASTDSANGVSLESTTPSKIVPCNVTKQDGERIVSPLGVQEFPVTPDVA